MSVVYDAGVLIAADGDDRQVWLDHKRRLLAGVIPITTAPVIGQVSRSARQVQLRRFLRGCRVVAFADVDSHRVGALLADTGTSDVVDAHVALVASDHRAPVLTSDPDYLRRLADRTDHSPAIDTI